METTEFAEYIQIEAELKDYLDKDTKVEGDRVVSNHQRFVDISEDKKGNLQITPGIAWPYDSGRPFLDYKETRRLDKDAEDVPGGEPEKLAKHFANYLLAWQEDFDFPSELIDDIENIVEAELADVDIEQVDLDDGAGGVESCGSGVSIEFQEFENTGFYYISTYHRNDDGKPEDLCDHDYQDSLEGHELADTEKRAELAAKYANWLIGEINAASEA